MVKFEVARASFTWTASQASASPSPSALTFSTARHKCCLLLPSGGNVRPPRCVRSSRPNASSAPPATAAEAEAPGGEPQGLQRLPIATMRGNKLLQYVWDGKNIRAVEEEVLSVSGANHAGHVLSWLGQMQDSLWAAFFPNVKDVTSDYWEFLRWRLSQRFFSSTMQNFSTQALLTALGLGARRTFAASATINWLLKDGVGRIARMTVATTFGQSFDANLKRLRFLTSLVFTACIACEFLTPLFPNHFLLLASIASVGRAIGLVAFVSTSPAVQQALCAGGNLADLTSKTQAQHMVMDMAALAVSAALTFAVRNHDTARLLLPLCCFPICAAGDLTSIYHELKSVQLRTLNRERAEMLAERWLDAGGGSDVATAAQISASERLLTAPDVCSGLLPLAFVPVHKLAASPQALGGLMQRYSQERYMLAVRRPAALRVGPFTLPAWLHTPKPQLLVALRNDVKPADILGALLEASYLRQGLQHRLAAGGGRRSIASAAHTASLHEDLGPGGAGRSADSRVSRDGSSSGSAVCSSSGRCAPPGSVSGHSGSQGSSVNSGGGATASSSARGSGTGVAPSAGGGGGACDQDASGHAGWLRVPSEATADGREKDRRRFLSLGGLFSRQRHRAPAARALQDELGLPRPHATAAVASVRPIRGAMARLPACEWDELLADAHRMSHKSRSSFVGALQRGGWKTAPFLLSTSEKAAYVIKP